MYYQTYKTLDMPQQWTSVLLCDVELNLPIGLLWRDTFHDTESPQGAKYTWAVCKLCISALIREKAEARNQRGFYWSIYISTDVFI